MLSVLPFGVFKASPPAVANHGGNGIGPKHGEKTARIAPGPRANNQPSD
jgi:hypothetical protein